jgi:hypothetical protein
VPELRSAQAVALEEAALLLRPLKVLSTPQGATALVRELGWDFPAQDPFPGVPAAIGTKLTAVTASVQSLEAATDETDQFVEAMKLLGDVRGLLGDLPTLGTQMRNALSGAYQDFRTKSGIDTLLFRRLLDWLVASRIRERNPTAYQVGLLLGVLSKEQQELDASKYRREVVLDRVEWERLPKLLSKPIEVADEVYGWSSAFDAELFLSRLFAVLIRLGLPAEVREQDEKIGDALKRPGDERHEYSVALVHADSAAGHAQAGLRFSGAPGDGASLGPGIAIVPYTEGAAGASWEIVEGLELSFATTLGLAGGVALVLRPPRRVSVGVNLLSSPSTHVTGSLEVALRKRAADGGEVLLLGSPSASRLTLRQFAVGLSAAVEGTEERELVLLMDVEELAITVAPGDGDGFLQKVLPPDGVRAAGDMGLAVSSRSGLHFTGGGGLEVTLPVNKSLAGVVRLDSVYVALRADGQAQTLTAVLAVTGGLNLGPIAATVERVGVSAGYVVPKQGNGNLGVAGTKFAFEPPKGVGLKVGAGPVAGGGYLFCDPAEEQYAGALQLDLKALSLKAIGLLTTRMPDGSKGFSLLLIITAEFKPIQLSFGFTLNAVGGLVGINRSVNRIAMQAGLKDGSLDSVRFPKDVVVNAPRIISDLRAIFPVTPGQHVFGPMVAIGWGTPTLIKLEIGLLLELPSPLRLHILGKLKSALPIEEEPRVLLQIDAYGVIDFDRSTAELDGTLRDSRLVEFPLTGELAARANWATKPDFAFSAGGFNPRYDRPAGFPELKRLTLEVAQGDNPRLTLEAYFAITSNSLQLGAHAYLFAERNFGAIVGRFTLEAHAGFDALLRLPSLEFVVDLGGNFALKRNGQDFCLVQLELIVTGPLPLHAVGSANFKVLGLQRTIPVDMSIGPSAPPPPLEPVDPLPRLLEEVKEQRNWSATLPGDERMLVTLRPPDPADTGVVVHPLGELTLRQRVLPLNLGLELYGHHPFAAGALRQYKLKLSNAGNGSPVDTNPVHDMFAPAEFFELSDDQALSRPSFEPLEAGRRLKAPGSAAGSSRERTRSYKTVIVEPGQPTAEKLVKAATAAAGTLASSFENGDVIDGVTLATGDRILIKDQASASQNGIYVVAASGAPARASDADTGTKLPGGSRVVVEQGTVNADTGWVATHGGTPILGTDPITFSKLSPYTPSESAVLALARVGSAGLSELRNDGEIAFRGPAGKTLGVGDPVYVVAKKRNLTAADTTDPTSYVEAEARRQAAAAKSPSGRDDTQVVASHEV